MSNTLLIASWGRPGDWRNAVYVDCDSREMERASKVRACSSLVFMNSSVSSPTLGVIFGLDSIVDPGSFSAPGDSQSICAQAYWDAIRDLGLEGKCYSNYGEILDLSEKVYRRVVDRLFPDLSEKITIKILPALGRPGGFVKFDGDGRDFHSLGLLYLFKIIKDLDLEKLPRNIVLDLTHGINYMPTLTLQIARDLSNLILIMSSREQLDSVKIEAYNADPFPRYRGPEPELCMKQIYREHVKYISIPHAVERYQLLERRARIEDHLLREVEDINSLYKNYMLYVASSILYPMPLALTLLCLEDENYRKLEEALGKLPKIWQEGVEIRDQETCLVNRRLRILPKALYITLLSYLACRKVREIVKKEDVKNLDGRLVVSIEALKNLGESIYERISDIHSTIIGNELDKIDNASKDINEGEYRKLGELRRFQEETVQRTSSQSGERCPVDKRNLIAHAGLEKTVTGVYVSGGKTYIGYCIEDLKDPRKLIEGCGLKIETYS